MGVSHPIRLILPTQPPKGMSGYRSWTTPGFTRTKSPLEKADWRFFPLLLAQPAAQVIEVFIRSIQVELLGIEVVADPFQGFLVFFVLGVLEFFKEIGVATGATRVFGWASSFTLHATRISDALFGG